MSESIDEKYDKAFRQAGYVQPGFASNARAEMAQMVETIAKGNKNIDAILSSNQDICIKGGFIAEEFHAETFNLDATLKGDKARAYTDRYDDWNHLEWKGVKLKKNDVPDIVVTRDGKVSTTSQSKYYKNAEATAREMSTVRDGQVKYGDVDSLLGPDDQANTSYQNAPGQSEPVATTTIKEHAEAKAAALEATGGGKSEIDAYKNTAEKVTDKLRDGKSSSTSLSKKEADSLGAGDKSKLKQTESEYQTKSTLKHMGKAACGAAAMSAVVVGSMNAVRYIQMAANGEITSEEATVKIVGETVASAADSAVKASANAGVQSLMVRYGSEEAAMQVLAEQGIKNALKTNAATVGVVCVVDAIKDLVKLGTGEISQQEYFDRQGKGALTTTAGVVGGGLGAAGGVAAATALGAVEGSFAMTAATLAGGLSGSIIAGLAMTLAIENGIEKPYRDLVRNTENLQEAAAELTRLSETVFKSQIIFTHYIEAENQLEKRFQTQMRRVDDAGKRAMEIIGKI